MNNKKNKLSIILYLIVFFIQSFSIYGDFELELQLKVLQYKEAGPPRIYNGFLVLTYRTDNPVRYVGVRFEHEEFSSFHVYRKNSFGVFYCIYELPLDREKIRYRIVVDGICLSDPFNPAVEYDMVDDIAFSIVHVEKKADVFVKSPVFLNNRQIKFIIYLEAGQNVYLMGNFNNWDPYMYRLKEDPEIPGFYSLTIELSPGRYYYTFLVNGRAVPDPKNSDRERIGEGEIYNFFDVKG